MRATDYAALRISPKIDATSSIKYEEVYLRAYESAPEAKHFIGRYITFYNQERPHSSLDGRTPDAVYFNQPTDKAA